MLHQETSVVHNVYKLVSSVGKEDVPRWSVYHSLYFSEADTFDNLFKNYVEFVSFDNDAKNDFEIKNAINQMKTHLINQNSIAIVHEINPNDTFSKNFKKPVTDLRTV